MKHTKGKWKIGVPSEDGWEIFAETNSNVSTICGILTDTTIEEAEANAKLIATAPDLLKSLQEAEGIINRLSDERDTKEQKMIRNAIKKAT